MCRFKMEEYMKNMSHICFNTSYVSVQDYVMVSVWTQLHSFNTSYVSVQGCLSRLQMYSQSSFNTSYVSVQVFKLLCKFKVFSVSIHPMCRFKLVFKNWAVFNFKVSIHPMCRFKRASKTLLFNLGVVSIHPMCRFKFKLLNQLEG